MAALDRFVEGDLALVSPAYRMPPMRPEADAWTGLTVSVVDQRGADVQCETTGGALVWLYASRLDRIGGGS